MQVERPYLVKSHYSLTFCIIGKTFLFSSLIDHIRKTYIDAPVVFFYCKDRDPLRKTLHGVARSLIQQLLQSNPVSLDFLYEFAVASGEKHPSSFETYQSILKHIASAHDQLYIGIDGLDECEQEDRRMILSLLRHILVESSPNTNIKIFLASRWMKEIEGSLNSVLLFKIKGEHIRHDIRDYVQIRSRRLGENFGLDLERQKSISTQICRQSEGECALNLKKLYANSDRDVFTCTADHGQPHQPIQSRRPGA